MNPPTPPEAWLRGPLPGIDQLLLPAAHALVQEREDIAAAVDGARDADLWTRPSGADSAGFHLPHLVAEAEAAIDRAPRAARALLVRYDARSAHY